MAFHILHLKSPEGTVENRDKSSRFSTASEGRGLCYCIEKRCNHNATIITKCFGTLFWPHHHCKA